MTRTQIWEIPDVRFCNLFDVLDTIAYACYERELVARQITYSTLTPPNSTSTYSCFDYINKKLKRFCKNPRLNDEPEIGPEEYKSAQMSALQELVIWTANVMNMYSHPNLEDAGITSSVFDYTVFNEIQSIYYTGNNNGSYDTQTVNNNLRFNPQSSIKIIEQLRDNLKKCKYIIQTGIASTMVTADPDPNNNIPKSLPNLASWNVFPNTENPQSPITIKNGLTEYSSATYIYMLAYANSFDIEFNNQNLTFSYVDETLYPCNAIAYNIFTEGRKEGGSWIYQRSTAYITRAFCQEEISTVYSNTFVLPHNVDMFVNLDKPARHYSDDTNENGIFDSMGLSVVEGYNLIGTKHVNANSTASAWIGTRFPEDTYYTNITGIHPDFMGYGFDLSLYFRVFTNWNQYSNSLNVPTFGEVMSSEDDLGTYYYQTSKDLIGFRLKNFVARCDFSENFILQ